MSVIKMNCLLGIISNRLKCSSQHYSFVSKFQSIKYYSTSKNDKIKCMKKPSDNDEISGTMVNKYDIFRDDDSPMILDVDEERQLRNTHPELFLEKEEKVDEFAGMNLERGKTGIIDMEELVDVLKHEKAEKIMVVSIPKEVRYVDYMIVVSPRSTKHMLSMAEYVRRLYKKKCHPNDYIPHIEGKESINWMALDIGNIALHIMSTNMRKKYQLEKLWAIGPEYDDIINEKEDPLITLLEEHTSLTSFHPNDFLTKNEEGTDTENEHKMC